jgi:large subunit ribosomal protein L25
LNLVELNASVRETRGKEAALKMRAAGQVPAVIYGSGAAISISVSARELEKAIKSTNTSQVFVSLSDVKGTFKSKNALLKELQLDPVKKTMIHADFYEIAMDKKIKTKAVVTTEGKPAGVDLGGAIKIIMRELDIMCNPSDVPEKIEVNVASMKLGETILAGDLDLGDKIKVLNEPSMAVVTLVPPKRSEGAE